MCAEVLNFTSPIANVRSIKLHEASGIGGFPDTLEKVAALKEMVEGVRLLSIQAIR